MNRRREFFIAAGGLALAVVAGAARSTPAAMKDAIRTVVGNAPVRPGRVKIELPPLIENGNAVPLVVTVESPMSAVEYVKAIHVFNEKNPQPNVITAYLGPRAGRAMIATRIRLADTQTVIAVAELSDGSFWSGEASVIVTLAACLEGI